VTLVTGFLGAGKSTLVSHVLTAKHGRRVAVVVNEFGAGLGLDRLLVQDGAQGSRCASRQHACVFACCRC
jgi:G3E family GTPase